MICPKCGEGQVERVVPEPWAAVPGAMFCGLSATLLLAVVLALILYLADARELRPAMYGFLAASLPAFSVISYLWLRKTILRCERCGAKGKMPPRSKSR